MRDLDVFFFAVVLFGGGDQRRFDALEDDLLVDVLVAVDRVNDPQQFAGIHRLSLPRVGTILPRSARPRRCAETLQNLMRP